MDTKNKERSAPTLSLPGDIPVEVMAKLQAAYQAPGGSSSEGCPDPETVIAYALEGLIPEKQTQVYAHLSECQDCLDLVLDLRAAWAEAQAGKQQVRERTPIRVQVQSWLAGLVDRASGSLSRLVPFPRLVPVAAALVVLVVANFWVYQHLTAPKSGQPPVTLTSLKPGTTHNYQARALSKVDRVSPGAIVMTRTEELLPFLPLLLEN